MGLCTYKISIKGTVQGVGFRPFIYQLATRFNFKGTVLNGTQGVEVVVNASKDKLEEFIEAIKSELPPLASIDTLKTEQIEPKKFNDFQIIQTDSDGEKTVNIPPDISICKACEKELFDPSNRR